MKLKPDARDRFATRINFKGPLPDQRNSFYKGLDRCWEWTGTKFSNGYGRFWTGHADTQAHRVAYFIAFGVDPAGRFVMHRCDNKGCVNPDHLDLGTPACNMTDMQQKGRGAVGDMNGSRKYPERLVRGDDHWLHKNPGLAPRGESSPVAVLTDHKVLEIRRLYASKALDQTGLARKFGITQAHVSQIIRRKIWKHLP